MPLVQGANFDRVPGERWAVAPCRCHLSVWICGRGKGTRSAQSSPQRSRCPVTPSYQPVSASDSSHWAACLVHWGARKGYSCLACSIVCGQLTILDHPLILWIDFMSNQILYIGHPIMKRHVGFSSWACGDRAMMVWTASWRCQTRLSLASGSRHFMQPLRLKSNRPVHPSVIGAAVRSARISQGASISHLLGVCQSLVRRNPNW